MGKIIERTAGFLFCGLGAGALGFMRAEGKLGEDKAIYRNLGGIDLDPDACKDFTTITGAPALCADLSKLQPADMLRFFGKRRPDTIFTSPPCKGLSRLLPKKSADLQKYQDLNALVFKGIALAVETWPDDPPPLFVLENVPGIVSRGSAFLHQIRALLTGYGYRLAESTHDCGEIGDLAQHRERFLLVARRESVVRSFVHQPPKHPVRPCGDELGKLPLPNDPSAGPLHVMPKISLTNWMRLALIPPGGDWRDLPKAMEPQPNNPGKHHSKFQVAGFDQPAATITSSTRPGSGAPSVADPRLPLKQSADGADSFKGRPGLFGVGDWHEPLPTVTAGMSVSGGNSTAAIGDPRLPFGYEARRGTMGVLDYNQPAATVTGSMEVRGSNTPASVADPRIPVVARKGKHTSKFRVDQWDKPVNCITSVAGVSTGAPNVADPRLTNPLKPGQKRRELFRREPVNDWSQPVPAVTGPGGSQGAQSVADPRIPLGCDGRNGFYGVKAWGEPSATVTGSMGIDNGPAAVADPREQLGPVTALEDALAAFAKVPKGKSKGQSESAPAQPPVIIAADGTWHRPLTDLDLAVLQGLPATINGRPLTLSRGGGMTNFRERIGNAVPVGAGKAIANSLLKALLASALGTWFLSSDGIWVRQDGVREEAFWASEADEVLPTCCVA